MIRWPGAARVRPAWGRSSRRSGRRGEDAGGAVGEPRDRVEKM